LPNIPNKNDRLQKEVSGENDGMPDGMPVISKNLVGTW
jgi:hypothetical protein